MARNRNDRKRKKSKNSTGGGYPAQQPPGQPRGIHVPKLGTDCKCGGCSS